MEKTEKQIALEIIANVQKEFDTLIEDEKINLIKYRKKEIIPKEIHCKIRKSQYLILKKNQNLLNKL